MHFHFRRAGEEDAAAVRSLSRAAYAKWVPVIGREPLPMKANYEAAVREHLVDLLEVDGMLAALVEMIPESEWLLVENLAVAPTFQRRGCATYPLGASTGNGTGPATQRTPTLHEQVV